MSASDPLSDVLRSVRLRGAVFFYVSCGDEWASVAPPASMLGPVVMPGAEHVIAYHLMARGDGWAAIDGAPPVRFGAGDVVLVPHGDGHSISSAPGLVPACDDGAWVHRMRNDPKPIPVTYHHGVVHPGAELPADEAAAVLVCGFIGCDVKPFNPLLGALPRLLHLRADGVGAWVAPALQQAVAECRQQRSGGSAVLERLSEMMFVDAARRYLASLDEGASGWLAALRDRHVGRALALLHERPAHAWSVDALGREVGLSRSALHERFLALLGQAPMHYLANWRIQCAAALLRQSDASVLAVAQEVGYDSEAAFSRAFKRMVGEPPATWRRRQRRATAAALGAASLADASATRADPNPGTATDAD
ncbi:AraC family transcriptional regulator [Piscinibacter koreensis]|uniref:AraC family transcriptional regulator n=1 Tax=Piscinibacter koreensis TaxID=2742824 RepID=A0A7Y6NNS7_9BURK|nr:AraC family transcriptional regulator [Schlegelella koreensis]NUZ06613.1 AraC family transcriptional regulator [Schlegelella koreensis]